MLLIFTCQIAVIFGQIKSTLPRGAPVKHIIGLALLLFTLWLGLSGHWDPLLLGLVGYSLQLVLDRDLDWSIAV